MLYVISGPSGVGKTTLASGLMARHPRLTLSISHTTRMRRGQERDRIDYHFVTNAEFDRLLSQDAFAEHASVFQHRYGTARSTLRALEAEGRDVLLDIDYQGAEQISRGYPDAVTVLLTPPSFADLEARLRGRATDSDEQVALRLRKAKLELSHYPLFRYVVVNDAVDPAVDRLAAIYQAERAKVTRNREFLDSLLHE